MTYKQPKPTEVRPNTLQGQSAPNTFRSQGGGTADRQVLNSGGGKAGPLAIVARPQLRHLLYIAVAVVVIVVLIYVLNASV